MYSVIVRRVAAVFVRRVERISRTRGDAKKYEKETAKVGKA